MLDCVIFMEYDLKKSGIFGAKDVCDGKPIPAKEKMAKDSGIHSASF